MRFLKHPLFLAILTVVVVYVFFAHVMDPPLPSSLLLQNMIIVVVGVLLVATFDNETARKFGEPIFALLGSPRRKFLRALAFLGVVVGAGWFTYGQVRPTNTAPLELRTVHPAPPARLKVYGKTYDLLSLTNPIRDAYEEGSEEMDAAISEGAEIYYKNCLYCHGDRLDGQGHFAEAFNPRPINFQDVGTIAQLQESFLFWRITTGGPGLPREGTPWASAMPVWHEMLSEDEVWKVITFLYDYTGYAPRSWELEQASEAPPAEATPAESGEIDVDAIYMKRCAQCHGEDGDGLGPAADYMYPKPRDFTLALFKFKSTDSDSEFPSDADFYKTIAEGLPGTAMPAWGDMLSEAEINALILKIKEFGEWEEEEPDYTPIEMPASMPAPSPELLARGRAQFVKACVQCHGEEGRGNVTSGKVLKDDLGERIWPRNLTRPETWRWTSTTEEVFQRLSTGIPGTPMPEHSTTMSLEDRWAIANYVMTLRAGSVPPTPGETVINAARIDGPLPSDPKDAAWEAAEPMTFPMAPNIIKEPRIYFSLNDYVTVRALYNDDDIAIRIDMDDRTYSVPGDPLERAYALEDIEPTRDAIAIQLPVELTGTSEKPWFRHGDPKHGVSMWYWAAPSVDPAAPETAMILDANGPDAAPIPRENSALQASGAWQNGRWQVVFTRARATGHPGDIALEDGAYVPIAFADWDGLAGEAGGRHSFTTWYWLRIAPAANPLRLYGLPAGMALLAGALFALLAWRMRQRFKA